MPKITVAILSFLIQIRCINWNEYMLTLNIKKYNYFLVRHKFPEFHLKATSHEYFNLVVQYYKEDKLILSKFFEKI